MRYQKSYFWMNLVIYIFKFKIFLYKIWSTSKIVYWFSVIVVVSYVHYINYGTVVTTYEISYVFQIEKQYFCCKHANIIIWFCCLIMHGELQSITFFIMVTSFFFFFLEQPFSYTITPVATRMNGQKIDYNCQQINWQLLLVVWKPRLKD